MKGYNRERNLVGRETDTAVGGEPEEGKKRGGVSDV